MSLSRRSLLKSAGLAVAFAVIIAAAFLQIPSVTSPHYGGAELAQRTKITVTKTLTVTTPIPTPAPTPITSSPTALKTAVERARWPVRIISLKISLPGAEFQSVSGNLKIGETYYVVATVVRDRHNNDGSDHYLLIVQVNDANGICVAQSLVEGILPIGSENSLALQWTPLTVGDYTVKAFVWRELKGYALAEAKEMQVHVGS